MFKWQMFAGVILLMASASQGQMAPANIDAAGSTIQVQVLITGGHDTDPRDRGRPVVLIASGLGVPPAVFRAAFSHVHPAPAGTAPDPEQVRRNKAELLRALGRYGVTNQQLHEVSNYYRYNRSRGEMWPTLPASAYAVLRDGKVIRFVVTNGGSGYSSPPTITVPGAADGSAGEAQLFFSRSARTNGSVANIRVVERRQP